MSQTRYVPKHGLEVAEELAAFVEGQVLPGTGIDADRFWSGYAELLGEFAGENRALLDRRAELQGQPKIAGFLGPFWGGLSQTGDAIIRYEDAGTYSALSQ